MYESLLWLRGSARFVGGGGVNPPLVPLDPKFIFTLTGSYQSKIHQKYMADPALVSPQIDYCWEAFSQNKATLKERPT